MRTISIVICTYNRCSIFEMMLQHLLTEVNNIDEVEIIVADNNSTDDTNKIVTNLIPSHSNLKYLQVTDQGLSYARNAGFRAASGDYVLYLDDDALAHSELLNNIHKYLAQIPDMIALGGAFYPWYFYEKPKWYKDKFATRAFSHKGLAPIQDGETWTGCVMMIKRDVLLHNPFKTNLGMTGKKTFYGEDTELQYRLQDQGVIVYGSNLLRMEHLVHAYKLNLDWFFRQKKALAESMYLMEKDTSSAIYRVSKGIVFGVLVFVKGIILNTPKLLLPDYYIQNFKIDTLTRPYKWWVYTMENFK